MELPKLPKQMESLERDGRGYPILFSLARRKGDGGTEEVDFTAIDPGKVLRCGYNSLCGICGGSLRTARSQTWLPTCFIGGGYSILESHCFNDPAMHKECATWAMEVCPCMILSSYRRKPAKDDMASHPAGVDTRPTFFGMIISRGYYFLDQHGLFVANLPTVARLWKPGTNTPPSQEEIDNYLDYFKQQNATVIEKHSGHLEQKRHR